MYYACMSGTCHILDLIFFYYHIGSAKQAKHLQVEYNDLKKFYTECWGKLR